MQKIYFNPSISELYKYAIIEENLNISSTGALLAYSGDRTGRSPKDKRIVFDNKTKNIWWGEINIPILPKLFNFYKKCAVDYLNDLQKLYQIDVIAGWDKNNSIK